MIGEEDQQMEKDSDETLQEVVMSQIEKKEVFHEVQIEKRNSQDPDQEKQNSYVYSTAEESRDSGIHAIKFIIR